MSDAENISAKALIEILHAQAHVLQSAFPDMSADRALRKVATLAVLVHDKLYLANVLRNAAREQGVPARLAAIVSPPGGATKALASVSSSPHSPAPPAEDTS